MFGFSLQPSKDELSPLPRILAKISDQLREPEKFIPYQSTRVEIDNTVTSATSTTTTSTTTTSSSTSSAAATQAKKNLSKIFEDAEPSTAGDVEMLPPYEVAMDKTITKSSTINSLVDFIQQDNGPATLISKLNSRVMNARNGRQPEMVVTQSEIEVNRDLDVGDEQTRSGSQMNSLQIVEESGIGRTRKETKEKSQVYTVRIETVCSNTNVGTTVSTNDTSKPKNGDNGQNTRTLPLSFSNPAFQLSLKALRQKDAGTDSMSSVNSTPSNGADSDLSNRDGDVSHSSSSSGASPPRPRRTKKGKSFHADISQGKHIAHASIEAHTLPKASSRSHAEMIGDIFQPTESHLPESYSSSSSIHTKMTLPMGSTCRNIDSLQPKSPTEAVKAHNFAQREYFFKTLIPPTMDETSLVFDPNSNNQSTQTSEANFKVGSSSRKNDLPPFTLNMPNPKTQLSQNYSNQASATFPLGSSRLNIVHNQDKSHSEVTLPLVSQHRSNDQIAHIRITPSQVAQKVGTFPVLDTPRQTHNRTANNSTGLSPQNSPPLRQKIITQLISKPKQTSEGTTCTITQDYSITESSMPHNETRPSRVKSGLHHRPVPSGASVSEDPVWTRRSQDSPSHEEVQSAEEKLQVKQALYS